MPADSRALNISPTATAGKEGLEPSWRMDYLVAQSHRRVAPAAITTGGEAMATCKGKKTVKKTAKKCGK